jgi:hypothetical protein
VIPIPTKTAAAEPLVNSFISPEASKSASPAPQASVSPVVKFGSILGGSGKGLILKGATEKPTLVAKPPGPPTPVKSPWAPLPPVEKAAAISSELQQANQSQSLRFSQRDPHSFENMPPPAKEIAADDFSRSWREGNSGSNRELYNSQSGRYEPVNDGRRGLARAETQSRQPALLHRPSNQEQQGPAEPSAAFQTHRATVQDGNYGRRRTSSNVSGGSGNFGLRMSKGQEMRPPHEMLNARRGSLVAASESPSSPRNHSPSGLQMGYRGPSQQQWQPRVSPAISHASPTSIHGQMAAAESAQSVAPPTPLESEIELQKRIMRESRELARKRRLEEEAREEAERKERIRLKLEAMGPPPESKKSKKDTIKDDKVGPTYLQSRDVTSTPISPPKPPIPESAGEVKQYGLMKVHHPDSVASAAVDSKVVDTDQIHLITQDAASNEINLEGVSAESTETSATSQSVSHDSRPSPGWQNSSSSGPDRYASWSSQAVHPAQGRNVWGPPTNDRTLGNGTFNPELSRLPDIHGSQSSQLPGTSPGPIGPPNLSRANGQYPLRGREQYGQRPTPIAPPHRQQGLARLEQQRTQAITAWNNLPEKLAQDDARACEEQRKLDTSREDVQASSVEIKHQPVFKDTWRQVTLEEDGTRSAVKSVSHTINNGASNTGAVSRKKFATHLAQEDAAERAKSEEQDTVRRPPEATGAKAETAQPLYKDTWRQVQLDSNGARSEVLNSTVSVQNGSSTTASPSTRGSRFFPQSKDIRLEDPATSFPRPESPLPPPPTMAGHPAYDGDTTHPHVSLPRPPPVVKLPPPKVLAPIGPPKVVSPFTAVAAPTSSHSNTSLSYQQRQQDTASRFRNIDQGSSRPHGISSGADWQDRINHLIGRKSSSPPKTHTLAVDSSSKNALEVPTNQISATVSLPSSASSNISDDDDQFETKPMAEECFEEQEMGSLPAIRVPSKAPEAAWQLAPAQNKPLPRKFAVTPVTSADPMTFPLQTTNSGSTIHIRIPGMPHEKCANIPHKMESRQKSNPRRQGQSRGGAQRHASSSHPRGGRSRDASSGLPSSNQDTASVSSSTNSTPRAGTRNKGGIGSHWSSHRHVSTSNSAINV